MVANIVRASESVRFFITSLILLKLRYYYFAALRVHACDSNGSTTFRRPHSNECNRKIICDVTDSFFLVVVH